MLLIQQTEHSEVSTKVRSTLLLNRLILDSQRCICSQPIRIQLPGHHNLCKTEWNRKKHFVRIQNRSEYTKKSTHTQNKLSKANQKLRNANIWWKRSLPSKYNWLQMIIFVSMIFQTKPTYEQNWSKKRNEKKKLADKSSSGMSSKAKIESLWFLSCWKPLNTVCRKNVFFRMIFSLPVLS